MTLVTTAPAVVKSVHELCFHNGGCELQGKVQLPLHQYQDSQPQWPLVVLLVLGSIALVAILTWLVLSMP